MKKSRIRLIDAVAAEYPEMPRSRIFSHILSGEVVAAGQRIRNPAHCVERDTPLEIKPYKRFVSRGGTKLEAVLKLWNIQCRGKVFVDAGASTGGFTDCLLQNGAALVYAVDVGYNQLAYKLRSNPKVRALERTNVMALSHGSFDPQPHAAVADMAFRSIGGAASHLLSLVSEKWLIALVKPQFEWVKPDSRFRGVVEGEGDLLQIAGGVVDRLWSEKSYVNRIAFSPLRGAKGNRELFFLISAEKAVSKENILASLRDLSTEGPG
jgi:23S rRNA (cytidine1920-2'-O)/16S rRNA (cytidine1409-2'-O)-methyltransferase